MRLTSALAHLPIAVSFWNQRRYDDVIVWANKALDRDPQHPSLVNCWWRVLEDGRSRARG